MTTLTRWNPFRELDELSENLSSFWGLTPARRSGVDDGGNRADLEWSPRVDISEDDKEYVIKADLPDLSHKDINVRVENGVLYVSGERKKATEEKGKKYHRVERFYGRFVRSFRMPEDADVGKVDAQFKNGVLTVRLSKAESARPKSIEVQVG